MARTDTPLSPPDQVSGGPIRADQDRAVEMARAGYTHGEIAKAMGVTRDAVGGILRRLGVRSGRLRMRHGQPAAAGSRLRESPRAKEKT